MSSIGRPSFFRTDIWMSAWKKAWMDSQRRSDIGYELECPLPFYFVKRRLFKILPVVNVYPFGITSPFLPSLRSEYFQLPEMLLAKENWLQQWSSFRQHKWSIAYFSDLLIQSKDYAILKEQISMEGFSALADGKEFSYGVNTEIGFNDYLLLLSKNTRIKLHNKRSKLLSNGVVEIRNMWPDYKGFIELLNHFHLQRWGKPCYSGRNLAFVQNLFINLIKEEIPVDLSVLSLNGNPISAVFDIHYGGRVYNFQSGFDINAIKNISIGIIHFGYQIEAACKNPEIHYYDFMAGLGKYNDYKKSISTDRAEFVTLKIIRYKWLHLFLRFTRAVRSARQYF